MDLIFNSFVTKINALRKGRSTIKYRIKTFVNFFLQIKAKTELLLSAEAAKTAQRADLQNHLDTAQNALQDKQQVGNLVMLWLVCATLTFSFIHMKSYVSGHGTRVLLTSGKVFC